MGDLFAAMYRDKGPIIKKYLVKIGCSKEDAEDIVQETFMKGIDYMVHLEVDNVSAWLFKVALNKYYDLCRKNKRRPQLHIETEHFLQALTEDEEGLSLLIRQEEAREVQKVLEGMNALYKNLLLMKYDMNLSYKEIGEVVSMSEDKVRTYLYRGRNAFKKGWKE